VLLNILDYPFNKPFPDSIYDEENRLNEAAKPYSTDSTVLKHNHPLMIMVKNEQEDLLVHPLVSSLLMHKWRSFARWVYYFNLFVYCTFLVFLTGYVCSTTPPYMYL
jgi:transient receptor potential cation channel subfamily A protein 1